MIEWKKLLKDFKGNVLATPISNLIDRSLIEMHMCGFLLMVNSKIVEVRNLVNL